MNNTERRTILILSSMALLGAAILAMHGPRRAWGRETSAASWNAPAAKTYLDDRAHWWLNWSGAARGHRSACLSCHTSMPIALAQPALDKSLGIGVATAEPNALANNVALRVDNWPAIITSSYGANDPCVCYYGDKKASSLGTESVLNALVLVNDDSLQHRGALGRPTLAALGYLWDQQQADGSWLWLDFGLRPWETDGTYYGTALAAVAVGMAGRAYYTRSDLVTKVAAMTKYLSTGFADRPLHDRTVCLWASSWLPGILDESRKTALINELLRSQEPDGGWSLAKLGVRPSGASQWQSQALYPAGGDSDGYATGLVVLALERSGVPERNLQLARGIAWLKSNERDGSWPAAYLNQARDPQSDIGGFMRDASTAFAVLALTDPDRR